MLFLLCLGLSVHSFPTLLPLDLIVDMCLVRADRGRTPGTASIESVSETDDDIATDLPPVKDSAVDRIQAKQWVCVIYQLISFPYSLS